jgi:tripartite-type tricarboxylate transporter receptor subunit TctC
MRPPGFFLWMSFVATMVLGATVVSGQNPSTELRAGYPNKPIRIVTADAGGNGDFHARLIAQGLTSAMGQPVIVENRATIISAETVANATPDGYTLMVDGGIFWIAPLLQRMPYDPVREFSPITTLTLSPLLLVVNSSLPVKSVKELIALAKAKPGDLNYAGSGTGTSANQLAAKLFVAMAGVNIVKINYKGSAQAVNDLIGGQVHVMFGPASSVAPHIKSGRLKALAVTSAHPSTLFPGLPTVAASGLPGYEAGSRQGIWAPAKTPATTINRLNQEIVRVLNRAEVKERLLSIGVETAPSSPEEFAAAIKSDMARLRKVIKDAGITAD